MEPEKVYTEAELQAVLRAVREHSKRRGIMFGLAFVGVLLLAYSVIFYGDDLREYAQGVLTMILGAFLTWLGMIYNFEFGSTRSSAAKDKAIAAMQPEPEQKP